MSRAAGLLALLLAASGLAAAAPTLVIYRCIAADGSVTLQNGAKCPKGVREQKRTVATPAPTAPLRAEPVVAPTPTQTATATTTTTATAAGDADGGEPASSADAVPDAATPPGPAPMLYVCLTADAQRYFGDAERSTRCAPLDAVGLDGRSATAAQACEVVEDRCEPVPDAERCTAWAERRRVAEQALTFSPEQIDAARAEIERIDAALAGTVCGR